MKTRLNPNLDKDKVLTKALINLAKHYDLTGKELSSILGISEPSITRLYQGITFISPSTKAGEMALLLLRIYRSLNALVGNNHEKAKVWLNSVNRYFSQKPLEHMKTITGLIDVVNYLDAIRGKY